LLDSTVIATDAVFNLKSLLAEVHRKPFEACTVGGSSDGEMLRVDEIQTLFDLSGYINVSLTTSPTLKDLILLFTEPSSETETEIPRSWMEKLQKELDKLLAVAETMKERVDATVGRNDCDKWDQ